MLLYHGTNKQISLTNLSEKYSINKAFGPGVYFSSDLATAKSYGDNIIAVNIEPTRLVDGWTYDFKNIQQLRAAGYIGALIKCFGCTGYNVVIWCMNDIR